MTLVELVTSMAAMGFLMAGLASSVLVTVRAIPVGNNAAAVIVDSGQALSEFEADVASAKTIVSSSSTMIEMTVADRTGDNADETIRYEWSGVAGAPLTRRVNGGTVMTVQSNVSSFNLKYFNRPVVTMTPQTTVATVGPQVLASFAAYPSGTPVIQNFSIAASGASGSTVGWAGEYFYLANLPAGVSAIKFTQAKVWLKSFTGSTVDPTIAIHKAVGGGNAAAQTNSIGTPATIPRTSLTSTYAQVTVNFASDVTTSQVSQDFVLLLKGSSTTASASLKNLYLSSGAPADTPLMQWSVNSGSAWMPSNTNKNKYDVPFEVWGTYETTTTSQVPISTYFLKHVDVTLIAGTAPAARLDVTAVAPNAPQIAGP